MYILPSIIGDSKSTNYFAGRLHSNHTVMAKPGLDYKVAMVVSTNVRVLQLRVLQLRVNDF